MVNMGIMKNIKSQSGFTLIEVLMAMLVLTFGLLAIAAVFAQGGIILVNTPVQLAAKELAYEFIDEIVVIKDAGLVVPAVYVEPETEFIRANGRTFLAGVTTAPTSVDGELRVEITVTYWINGIERKYETAVIIGDIDV